LGGGLAAERPKPNGEPGEEAGVTESNPQHDEIPFKVKARSFGP